MNRIVATALVVTTLCSANAFADGVSGSTTQTAADIATTPSAGHVPLSIRVTEARRVFVRDAASANGLRYMCTTPCRLYVRPGNVDVTLVGWGAHEYHWEVPEHGGSVSLLARPMPAEVAAARAAAARRDAQLVQAGAAFGLAHSLGGAAASGIAMVHALGDEG